MSKKEIATKKNNPPVQELTLDTILKAAVPLMKEWRNSEVEKMRIEGEADKYFFDKEHDLKKKVISGVIFFIFIVLGITIFLFISGKDKTAQDILTLLISIVLSFIGGYGLAKSHYSTSE